MLGVSVRPLMFEPGANMADNRPTRADAARFPTVDPDRGEAGARQRHHLTAPDGTLWIVHRVALHALADAPPLRRAEKRVRHPL